MFNWEAAYLSSPSLYIGPFGKAEDLSNKSSIFILMLFGTNINPNDATNISLK